MLEIAPEYRNAIDSSSRIVHAKVIIDFSPIVQLTFTNDDIVQMHLIEDTAPAHQTFPHGQIGNNRLEIKLYDKDRHFDPLNTTSPIYGLVKTNCKVQAYIGFELQDGTTGWLTLGTFYTSNWKVSGEWVTTIATDSLQQLKRSQYSGGILSNSPAVVVHVDDTFAQWSQGYPVNVAATTDGSLILNISGVI